MYDKKFMFALKVLSCPEAASCTQTASIMTGKSRQHHDQDEDMHPGCILSDLTCMWAQVWPWRI